MPEICQVVVADENNGIGKNNELLCHLPADLRHFKKVTTGFPIIMGRKTFDSIGRPLPNRRNIVVTKHEITIPGCEIAHSLLEALALCEDEQRVSIVGGGSIYQQSLDFTDTIELTRIHHTFDADTYFPELRKDDWEEVSAEDHPADEKNPFPYSFITLKRKA